MRYMAKAEPLRGPLAWLLPRLGAFPVRRGEADAEAVGTALAILAQGGLVVVFPEGTRVDEPDALGSPHHGAGRLALESSARSSRPPSPARPGSRLGPLPKPRRVLLSFLEPVEVSDLASARDALSLLIDQQVWPAVQREYGRLAATPGLVAAALAALGLGGLALRRQRKATPPRIVGIVEPRRLRRRARARARRRRLPGLRR